MQKREYIYWDFVANYYYLFENLYNGGVNRRLCRFATENINSSDKVLECACGTGMISVHIASKCKS